MEWKYYLIVLVIFVLGCLIMLSVGLYNKDNLNEEVGSINSLDDVIKFLEKCEDKLFLDCKSLLKRELELNSIN